MNLFPLKIIGGVIFFMIITLTCFTAGWTTRGWKYDSQYKQSYIQALAEVKTQDLANQKMAQEYQRKISVYQKKMDSINVQIKTEVDSHSIYSTCILPTSGLQLINTAINSTNTAIFSS